MSAKESSCFPNSPHTFKILAANPSKKSRKAPKNIQRDAFIKSPWKENVIANRPQAKLLSVIKLGIFLFILFI